MLTDTIKRAIKESGLSRYRLSIETGVEQAVLSRFMHGGGLKLETADKLCEYLGLELIRRPKSQKKR